MTAAGLRAALLAADLEAAEALKRIAVLLRAPCPRSGPPAARLRMARKLWVEGLPSVACVSIDAVDLTPTSLVIAERRAVPARLDPADWRPRDPAPDPAPAIAVATGRLSAGRAGWSLTANPIALLSQAAVDDWLAAHPDADVRAAVAALGAWADDPGWLAAPPPDDGGPVTVTGWRPPRPQPPPAPRPPRGR